MIIGSKARVKIFNEIWVPRLRNLDFDCNFDRVYNNYYNYTSFDVEFDEDFEFLFKILIPPTHFE